jgi:Carboxypeptidase regulatory-like domain/TonB dependent receptor
MIRLLRFSIACCVLLAAVTATFGQIATTSLRGIVRDNSGAVVQGASVTLLDQATGTTYHAESNAAGLYAFPIITPARYLVTITSKSFATQSRTAELLVDQPATIDFTLSVAAQNITVDVTEEAQTLNFTDASMGNAVGNNTIEALPMEGRDPINLLSLQPGVLYLGTEVVDSRTGAVSGGRSDQGNITLDGLDDNDQVFGAAFTGIIRSTLDSTEEFRVTTSNGTVASGRSSGAQVNLVTKSGTNRFHGALYEYYRPNNTVANSFFLKNEQVQTDERNVPQHYVMNTFGGAIGGPIVKDKLFFFFNYEGQRQAIDYVVGATVPTASFMAGGLQYTDPNGTLHQLNAAQVAQLDQPCTTQTFNGAPVCPNGPGANAAVLSYYANVPLATGAVLGDGLNSGSYFFTSPAPTHLNTNIGKIDYTLNSKNRLFLRGNLQRDTSGGTENLPGQPPQSFTDDNTKGLAAGYTWVPTPHIINDLRYGYVRQGYQTGGIGQGQYVVIDGLQQPTAQTRNTYLHVPVHNITDTVSWIKGVHNLQIGGNWRLVSDQHGTDANSFNGASTNAFYASQADLPDPNNVLDGSFAGAWEFAYADLMGVIPEEFNVYNYALTSPTLGTALPVGAFVQRSFRANEFEYFLQDTWQVRRNLTLTLGLRHTILQTPFEIHGQQESPTIDMDAWYKERETAALQGQVYEPQIFLAPSGKANHEPGYWPKQKKNIAPRIGVVWAPDQNTSVRASAGMYYDHYGEALVYTFDQVGSLGLNAGIANPADSLGFENSPRFTGPNNIPVFPSSIFPPAQPTQTFPYQPPFYGFGIDWGIDNRLKTPYAEAANFSVQRKLPGGWTGEAAYVGRFGKHLLQQLDLAEPTDLVDTQGGGDYFSAARILSAEVDAAPFGPNGVKAATVAPIKYFEDMFPYMAGVDYAGESATQAIFNNAWAPQRYTNGETLALAILDVFQIFPGSPATPRFWTSQFSSLYSQSSIGTSSYNAMQLTLRHPVSHGLTVDFGYTLAKSLDLGSETERASVIGNVDDAYTNTAIQNTWNPRLNRGPSDFDTRSAINADWVYALPVGHGKQFLSSSSRAVDAVLGGWQISGLNRWTSGLPFTLESPAFPTNYDNPGMAIKTAAVPTHREIVDGVPREFTAAEASAIGIGYYGGTAALPTPMRLPYAGEAGERNNFRGDGVFDLDMSVSKSWALWEGVKLKFAAEAYNLTNSVRFDVSPNGLAAGLANPNLGIYSQPLSTYRRMQFGLRLDF